MRSEFDYVRSAYGVPAKRGGRVEYTGGGKLQFGTITAGAGHRVRIRLDGEKHTGIYHPTWELRYLDPTPSTDDRAGSSTGETV